MSRRRGLIGGVAAGGGSVILQASMIAPDGTFIRDYTPEVGPVCLQTASFNHNSLIQQAVPDQEIRNNRLCRWTSYNSYNGPLYDIGLDTGFKLSVNFDDSSEIRIGVRQNPSLSGVERGYTVRASAGALIFLKDGIGSFLDFTAYSKTNIRVEVDTSGIRLYVDDDLKYTEADMSLGAGQTHIGISDYTKQTASGLYDLLVEAL